jgi:hypothetical protein
MKKIILNEAIKSNGKKDKNTIFFDDILKKEFILFFINFGFFIKFKIILTIKIKKIK